MAVILAKTGKGHAEIAHRSGELSARIRRVQIFIDGKCSVEELRNLEHCDDLQHRPGLLEEQGLIEMLEACNETRTPGGAAPARCLPGGGGGESCPPATGPLLHARHDQRLRRGRGHQLAAGAYRSGVKTGRIAPVVRGVLTRHRLSVFSSFDISLWPSASTVFLCKTHSDLEGHFPGAGRRDFDPVLELHSQSPQ